jgi:hypothetical protein
MREASTVSVMGLMASLMNRSDMVGILQVNPDSGKVETEAKGIIFPAMQPDLYQLLISRPRQQGVNSDEAPALLRDLANILESSPGIDAAAASSKLQLPGWSGVALDDQSLQLALAWIESEKP